MLYPIKHTIEEARAKYPNMTGTDTMILRAAAIRDKETPAIEADTGKARAAIARYTEQASSDDALDTMKSVMHLTRDERRELCQRMIDKAQARIDANDAILSHEDAAWWHRNYI